MIQEEKVIELLQGKWKSDNGNVQFKIKDNMMIHIKGGYFPDGKFTLAYIKDINKWQIRIINSHIVDSIINNLDESYLEIYELLPGYNQQIQMHGEKIKIEAQDSIHKFYHFE